LGWFSMANCLSSSQLLTLTMRSLKFSTAICDVNLTRLSFAQENYSNI
jgi:hypothetical protein